MAARRVIVFSEEFPACSFLRRLFERELDCQVVGTEAEFLQGLQQTEVVAAMLCFCSARESSVSLLLRLGALAGPMPVLVCSKAYDPSFVHLAASQGLTNFLLCEMEPQQIRRFVLRTIRLGGLRQFLDLHCGAGRHSSPHAAKLVNEIVRAFPRRPKVSEVSQALGITTRRLQIICQDAFGRSFTHLRRRIWVHQALTMMQNTSLDNTEIALRLGYQDESSLARIFRKELGHGPSEARRRLARQSPDELVGEPR